MSHVFFCIAHPIAITLPTFTISSIVLLLGLESRVNNLEANFAGYRNGGELSGGVPIGGSYRNAANNGPMGDGYRNGANGGPTGDGYRNGGFGDGFRNQGILSFCDL